MLTGKTIVVGITGGIAAYKAAEVISQLSQRGAKVEVIMTRAAQEFISPLTLGTLAQSQVWQEFFREPRSPVPHIYLAEKADLVLIVPATAHTIARISAGLADDLLTAVVLATRAPVLLAPAMNVNMYRHPVTQENIRRLRERGYHFLAPAAGRLACGTEGEGRLPPVEEILAAAEKVFAHKQDLAGKQVLVTAGGTREPLDPVRYLSNRSSGKMGYALAAAAQERGAKVILVSAPTSLSPPPGVQLIPVETAQEMYTAVTEAFPNADVVVMAAAVADYRPREVAPQKIKKEGRERLILELEATPDILAALGKRKEHRVLVGFAAETRDALHFAREKMELKNLDLIVVNDVTLPGAGFGTETNIVTLLFRDGRTEVLPLLPKREVAEKIFEAVGSLLPCR